MNANVYTGPAEYDDVPEDDDDASDDDDDSSCDDDDITLPAPPWTPFDELLAAYNDALLASWRAEEEDIRAARRAWLTENNGWPR